MDQATLQAMSTEELAAARQEATPEEKQTIDAELARRQTEGEEGGEGGGAGGEGGAPGYKSEGDESGGDDMPYGSSVLSAAVEALQTASADIQMALKTVEQPDVKASLEDAVHQIEGIAATLGETYGKVYPGSPSMEQTAQPDADANVLKSFVQMGRDRQLRMKGIVGQLQAVIRDVQPHIAPRLKTIAGSLQRALAEVPTSEGTRKLMAEVEQLRKQMEAMRRR